MSRETEAGALRRLAAYCGIQASYRDASGRRRVASLDSLRAVVAAVVGSDAQEPLAEVRRLERARRASLIDPVCAAWRPGRAAVKLRINRSSTVRIEVEDEAGSVRGWKIQAGDLNLEDSETSSFLLPEDLSPGYYRVHASAGRRGGSSLLVLAPREAYRSPGADRDWGVFLPLYALHSVRSPAIADLGDLLALGRWIETLGGRAVATLPLLAQFYDQGLFEPSPYAPASRLMWNELYLNLTDVPEFRSVGPSSQALSTAASGDYLDYASLYRAKRTAIEHMQVAMPAGRRAELRAYSHAHPELDAYARFRSSTEARGPWTEWSDSDEPSGPKRGQDYHLYAQWLADSQIEALSSATGSGLYLDLPLGVHPASFDTWRWPDCFLRGLNAGAPPDPLATGGQDWGFPPLSPEGNRANSYEYVIAYLQHHLRYASRLRIDHVMGLHRLFVIPRGAPASEGVYLRYRPEELYAILSLESHRHRTEIVGENLGTVPAYVNQAMRRHDLSGMYVLPFEIDIDGGAIRTPPADSAASLNTHDLPTFAGWWSGADIVDRSRMGLLDDAGAAAEHEGRRAQKETAVRSLVEAGLLPVHETTRPESVRDGILRFIGMSPARLVLASLEDLWGETRPQNVPGTSGEKPNWRRRARLSLEEMQTSAAVEASLKTIDAGRRMRR